MSVDIHDLHHVHTNRKDHVLGSSTLTTQTILHVSSARPAESPGIRASSSLIDLCSELHYVGQAVLANLILLHLRH